jgi:ABC-type multidrug transport system fused ATPase/permease subunit
MEENKKLSVFFNFYKVIKYIERKNIKAIVIWGGLMLLVGILPAISVILNKKLIDEVSVQGNSSVLTCVLICVLMGTLEIMVSVLENICDVIYQKVNYQTTHKMEKKFYYTMINLPMEVFDDYKIRKEIILAQDGLSTNGIEIMENLISIVSKIVSIVSVFSMLYMVSWKLPLAIVGSMVPTLAAVIISKKMQYKVHQELVEERRKCHS